MLVIRRRPGETLLIGESVEVEVLEVTASYVKLGIRAPRSITVLRKEIQLTLEQNREAARELSPGSLELLRVCLQTHDSRFLPTQPIKPL